MSAPTDALRRERLETVLALAAPHVPAERRPMFEDFAREYFRRLDDDDLAERAPDDLSGALLSHWQFGAVRAPGKPKVRVLSPTVAEDGWASRHSVIEIVNDDMPFLVDSTTAEINRQGLTLHLIVHPIFAVERDAGGRIASLGLRRDAPSVARESWMHIEVDRLVDAQQRSELVAGIEHVLGDVRAAVEDWKPMVARLREAIAELDAAPASLPPAQVAESRAFLQWLADEHLTLLGYRQHDLVSDNGDDGLRLVPGSGLGVLRETAAEKSSASFAALPPNARALARTALPVLVVTKANTRSTVHRPGYTDYVGVKRYNERGEVVGEHRFLGLLTSSAYSARVAETPLLRGKVEAIVERAGLTPGGHLAKALDHILETYPRDELFQISDD
ncbi:MAG: NAD-glutamate dehydrogenase, partial [Caldimonas sp.]